MKEFSSVTPWHYKTISGFSYIQTAVGDGWFLFSRHPIFSLSSFFKREKKIMFEHVYTISPIAYVTVCLCNGASVQKKLWTLQLPFFDRKLWLFMMNFMTFSIQNINRWRAFPDTANCVHEKKKASVFLLYWFPFLYYYPWFNTSHSFKEYIA